MSLGLFDWVILAILGFSTVMGFFVGFIRSILSVLVWVGAVIASMVLGPALTQMFADFTTNASIQLWASYAVVFLSSVLIGWVIKLVAGMILIGNRKGGMDGLLGALFGFVRGILLVVVLVWFAVLSGVSQTSFYQQSYLPHYFESLAVLVAQCFPGASAAVQQATSMVKSGGQGLSSSLGGMTSNMGSAFNANPSSGSGSGGMSDTISNAQNLAKQVTSSIQSSLGGVSH